MLGNEWNLVVLYIGLVNFLVAFNTLVNTYYSNMACHEDLLQFLSFMLVTSTKTMWKVLK